MRSIDHFRQKFLAGDFEFSKHTTDQSILRRIRVGEIREAIADSGVIEDYPNDKYGPSCLIFGRTQADRILHIQCSYPGRSLVKIITVYEPDRDRWNADFAQRSDKAND